MWFGSSAKVLSKNFANLTLIAYQNAAKHASESGLNSQIRLLALISLIAEKNMLTKYSKRKVLQVTEIADKVFMHYMVNKYNIEEEIFTLNWGMAQQSFIPLVFSRKTKENGNLSLIVAVIINKYFKNTKLEDRKQIVHHCLLVKKFINDVL